MPPQLNGEKALNAAMSLVGLSASPAAMVADEVFTGVLKSTSSAADDVMVSPSSAAVISVRLTVEQRARGRKKLRANATADTRRIVAHLVSMMNPTAHDEQSPALVVSVVLTYLTFSCGAGSPNRRLTKAGAGPVSCNGLLGSPRAFIAVRCAEPDRLEQFV